MSQVQLQPGIYTNIFPVILPDEPVQVMVTSRAKAVDLRSLRNEIDSAQAQVSVYAHNDRVYGYGQESVTFLLARGFEKSQMLLKDTPVLAARVVLEGLIASALSKGFWQRRKISPKGFDARAEIFQLSPKGITTQGKVKVFAGYDLRCAYYPAVESLGLVVDATWAYQDENGTPLNMPQMRARNALNEALVVQEEFLRGTTRFNLQISQIRMHSYLLPFAQEFHTFLLPCGGQAQLESVPFPVIL
ncbi:MAG: hypothetical protein HZC39_13525 [Chloroflexi bacterium]|nr:hypothetical protein [Chloroflexota bacterium]MBI5704548.1 hypothetical protein [Chloroflexota bacterium]